MWDCLYSLDHSLNTLNAIWSTTEMYTDTDDYYEEDEENTLKSHKSMINWVDINN